MTFLSEVYTQGTLETYKPVIILCIITAICLVWIPAIYCRVKAGSLFRCTHSISIGESRVEAINKVYEETGLNYYEGILPDGLTVTSYVYTCPPIVLLAPFAPAFGGYTVILNIYSKNGLVVGKQSKKG